MNRRSFLATAIAAALAPAALIEGPFENIYYKGTRLGFNSTFNWWRNAVDHTTGVTEYMRGIPHEALLADMERLWKECVSDIGDAPNLIYVDGEMYEVAKKACPEMFA